MRLSALFKFSVDSIMRKFVKSTAITLLFAFALVLIAMCMIPNRIGAYYYHTLDHTLQKGVRGTGKLHMKEYKEECEEFVQKLNDIPGMWKTGEIRQGLISENTVAELYKIQEGHVPNRQTTDSGVITWGDDGFEAIFLAKNAGEMLRFRLAKGSYVPNDNPNDVSVTYLYLGSAYADIPIGKEYKSGKTTLRVMGIFEKGSVCMMEDVAEDGFSSAPAVTLDYLAVAVENTHKSNIYSDIFFSVEKPSQMQEVINRIYDLAKQYGIDVTVGSIDGALQENQKLYDKIGETLFELLLIVLLVAATVQACVQVTDMIGHFPMYGILYANGASKGNLCVLIALENIIRYGVACGISYGVIRLLLFILFPEVELLETVTRIFHMETAVWVCLIGLGVCAISVIVPLLMIQRKTPVELVGNRM